MTVDRPAHDRAQVGRRCRLGYTCLVATFRAVVAPAPGPATLVELSDQDLPDEDVKVAVDYSSLNYKDALAVTGRGRVIRTFPMTCGIDLAGTVLDSRDPTLEPGDEVFVTGWGLGESHPGGYSELQRIRPEWVARPPGGLDLRRCMAVGTAGLTAMLCILELEGRGVSASSDSQVLVTGAGGGVGSFAVALAASAGYRVAASTGRPELEGYLRSLGASDVIERDALAGAVDRPLQSERWAGVVDTVGGTTLASAIAQTHYGGAVAACGLAGGSGLETTVLPFILRAVTLVGIDSVMCPRERRAKAWRRVAEQLSVSVVDSVHEVRPMGEIVDLSDAVLAGSVRGRIVIDTRS